MQALWHATVQPATAVVYSAACECNGKPQLLVWTSDQVQVHELDSDGSTAIAATIVLCQPLEAAVKLCDVAPDTSAFLALHADHTLSVYTFSNGALHEVATATLPTPPAGPAAAPVARQLERCCMSQPYAHPRQPGVQYVALGAYHDYLHLATVSAPPTVTLGGNSDGTVALDSLAVQAQALGLKELLNPPAPSARGQDLRLLATTLHLRRLEFLPEALDPAGELHPIHVQGVEGSNVHWVHAEKQRPCCCCNVLQLLACIGGVVNPKISDA